MPFELAKSIGRKILGTEVSEDETVKEERKTIQIEAEDILERSRGIILALEQIKKYLTDQHGIRAARLFLQPVDAVINQAKALIEEIEEGMLQPLTTTEDIRNAKAFIQRATHDVAMCAQFVDLEKVTQSVQKHLHVLQREEIGKDIKILRDNYTLAIDNPDISKKHIKGLDRQMEPIFSHLVHLQEKLPDFTNLEEQIQWKMRIDTERAMLSQLGTLAIDSFIIQCGIPNTSDEANSLIHSVSQDKVRLDSLECMQCIAIEKCIMHIRSVLDSDTLTKLMCAELQSIIEDIQEYLLQMQKIPPDPQFDEPINELFDCLDSVQHRLNEAMQRLIAN